MCIRDRSGSSCPWSLNEHSLHRSTALVGAASSRRRTHPARSGDGAGVDCQRDDLRPRWSRAGKGLCGAKKRRAQDPRGLKAPVSFDTSGRICRPSRTRPHNADTRWLLTSSTTTVKCLGTRSRTGPRLLPTRMRDAPERSRWCVAGPTERLPRRTEVWCHCGSRDSPRDTYAS